jgi:hypothetical protein
MSGKIDVLAVMKEAAEDVVSGDVGLRLLRAAEAVAELIAADRGYDVTMAHRIEATNRIVSGDRSDDAFRRQASTDHAFDRACARRAAALAALEAP